MLDEGEDLLVAEFVKGEQGHDLPILLYPFGEAVGQLLHFLIVVYLFPNLLLVEHDFIDCFPSLEELLVGGYLEPLHLPVVPPHQPQVERAAPPIQLHQLQRLHRKHLHSTAPNIIMLCH